ncbi:MAG: CHAT domain-containing protein [Bryobacteraceae bacterium]
MSEHETAHLTDGQIIALTDGGGDAAAALHVESCAECRERVAQWRDARAWIAPVRAGPTAGVGPECPTMEELASYASGGQTGEGSDAISEHIGGCDRCAAILRDSLAEIPETAEAATPLSISSGREWRRRMAETFAAQRPTARPPYWKYGAAAAIFLAIAGGATLWWSSRRTSDTAVLLARAYTAERPFAYRLPDAGYAPVRQQRGTGSAFDRPEALESAVAAIRRGLASRPQAPALFALKGRAELLERDYESAIESLTRATSAAGGDPDALADLATAYAVRGEAENRNIDYGHAMELLLQALKQRPADQRILFNLALTYEKLWLVDEAIETWRQFLRESPAGGWRQEAETHLAAMEKIKAEKKKADARILHDPSQFLAAYSGAAFDPLPWYDVFWMDWLPEAARDKAAAGAARLIASGFTRFGEYSLIESLDAPASAAKDSGLALLASAMAANRSGHPSDALATARGAAAKLDAAGLRGAAALARNEFVYATRWAAMNRECLQTSELLLHSLGPRYPWIAGNAHLEHAACLQRLGEPGPARTEVERAGAKLAQAGLWPAALRATLSISDIDAYTGNYGPVWETAPEGLRRYWTTQASPYRAQASQFALQQAASALGWRVCSVVFYRAAIRFAHDAGNGEMEASLRSRLAQVLQQLEDYPGEVRELNEVSRLLDRASQSPDVRNMLWEAALRRVAADIATKAERDPLPELDRLAAEASAREATQRIDLEQTRGIALQARGDFHGATAAFSRAVELNKQAAQSAPLWVRRIPIIESAAPAYRNLTKIELVRDGDPAKALATWRQFRPGSGEARRSVIMALLPAGIAILTADGNIVKARWVEGDAEELRRASGEFLALCASPTSNPSEIRRQGNRLYRALVSPELRRLGPGTVFLTTESWLSEIPFGALTDDSGDYLFRRFHFVQGYGPGAEGTAGAIAPESTALIVTAPAAVAPGRRPLPILPTAEREAAQVAARFSNAVMQREATVEWLAANAPRASVFHFCGHGWANGGNGALILPPGPNGEPRFVTSANLAEQNWSRCQLAVLSACLTAAGETRGVVNNQSLVQALLGAGARRVVAARWSIDSEATRALMDGFYARLVSGKSVPEALSGAAADVAASPGWSHPYFWAGFDVFGAA